MSRESKIVVAVAAVAAFLLGAVLTFITPILNLCFVVIVGLVVGGLVVYLDRLETADNRTIFAQTARATLPAIIALIVATFLVGIINWFLVGRRAAAQISTAIGSNLSGSQQELASTVGAIMGNLCCGVVMLGLGIVSALLVGLFVARVAMKPKEEPAAPAAAPPVAPPEEPPPPPPPEQLEKPGD